MKININISFVSLSDIERNTVHGFFVREANNKEAGVVIATFPDKMPWAMHVVRRDDTHAVSLKFELASALSRTEMDTLIQAESSAIAKLLPCTRAGNSAKLTIDCVKELRFDPNKPRHSETKTATLMF